MMFVTNRTPVQSNRTRLNRKIRFNLQDTGVSQNMYFCERRDRDDYIEIGSQAFFSQLKTSLGGKTQILLYIHGFNNTGEKEIFPNAERLQSLLDQEGGSGLVHVVPLIWPCDDDSVLAIVDDYWDDQRAADASGMAFARLLGKFDTWRREPAQCDTPCLRRINILAHSMGNRVLKNALATWAKFDGQEALPLLFRNVFMVAGDVVNHVLEPGEEGHYITESARNVVVYYAADDLAMPASKLGNLKRTVSRRLGMTGPEDLDAVPRNVYEVDCDDFNNAFDWPKGHSYFLDNNKNNIPGPVLKHMVKAIENGRVTPNIRHHELSRPADTSTK